MVTGKIRADESICIIDDNKCYIFNKMGRFINKIDVPMDVATSQTLFKAVSIVSTLKGVLVGVFDEKGISEMEGKDDTAVNVTMYKGYLRRLLLSGVESGVRYTQMVFIYDSSVDVMSIIKKLV